MAASGAKVSVAAVPKDQASPPGFVTALTYRSRRVREALQAWPHTNRSIPPPVLQEKGTLSD